MRGKFVDYLEREKESTLMKKNRFVLSLSNEKKSTKVKTAKGSTVVTFEQKFLLGIALIVKHLCSWVVRQSADRQSADTIAVNRQSADRQSAKYI